MAKTIQTKQCSKCKKIKPFSEFWKNLKGLYGIQSRCKKCMLASQKANFTNRRKSCLKYSRSKKGKTQRKKYENSEKGKNAIKICHKRYYEKHKNRCYARTMIAMRIKAGRLPNPTTAKCFYCKQHAQEYHHHLGYDKVHWFDVVPICTQCHVNLHKSPSRNLSAGNKRADSKRMRSRS